MIPLTLSPEESSERDCGASWLADDAKLELALPDAELGTDAAMFVAAAAWAGGDESLSEPAPVVAMG
jgi:hypothetical protein